METISRQLGPGDTSHGSSKDQEEEWPTRVLYRLTPWTGEWVEHGADQRHVEIQEFHLMEATSISAPSAREE